MVLKEYMEAAYLHMGLQYRRSSPSPVSGPDPTNDGFRGEMRGLTIACLTFDAQQLRLIASASPKAVS